MLNKNPEKLIFLFIFTVIYLTSLYFATQIKINELEINKGKTPEQIIEESYPELSENGLAYKYRIIDDFLFVCMESETNYCSLDFAFKTKNSGYIFDIPGTYMNAYALRTMNKSININDVRFFYLVYHVQSKYVIQIAENFKKSDIQIYDNQTLVENLTFDDALNQHWAAVITDLETPHQITIIYRGNEYPVVNTDEIISFFGAD